MRYDTQIFLKETVFLFGDDDGAPAGDRAGGGCSHGYKPEESAVDEGTGLPAPIPIWIPFTCTWMAGQIFSPVRWNRW